MTSPWENTRYIWVLVALSGLSLVIREPGLWLDPEFQAEEATVYFAGALNAPDMTTALTAPHLGVFSLTANLGGILATWMPLGHEPIATLVLAFLVQMLPFVVVAFGRALVWRTIERKTVSCLIILLFGQVEALHLNTMASMFHFAALAALIYIEFGDFEPGGARSRREGPLLALLAFAGFSSVQACLLMPAFWLRLLIQRRPADRVASLVLTAAVIVQASAAILSTGVGDNRFIPPADWAEQAWCFTLTMVTAPLFGQSLISVGWIIWSAVGFVGLIFLALQGRILAKGPHRDWLMIAWLVSLASTLASPGMAGDARYRLVGCLMLGLLLLALAVDRDPPAIWRRLAALLLVIGILLQATLWSQYLMPA